MWSNPGRCFQVCKLKKSIDVVLGSRTQGRWMRGADGSIDQKCFTSYAGFELTTLHQK